jgi:hypothetical protein
VSAQTDASAYLGALFDQRPEGSLIVITPTKDGKFERSRFCRSVEAALYYVLGTIDTYVRITPVGREPKSGRGKAADAVALQGVWCELDINGSPDRDGKPKSGALPSAEAAIDVASRVLRPSMLVGSGGGVHTYELFDSPFVLRTPEDYARAKRVVKGFQARLRAEAQEHYGAGVDSTHDLSRVLRPPSTANAKSSALRPVVLLSNTGARYSIEEIEAEMVVDARANGIGCGEYERPPEKLTSGRHAHLVSFATHMLRGGITDEATILAHLRCEQARACVTGDERPGELEDIASWAADTEIAKNERELEEFSQQIRRWRESRRG